VNALVKKYHYSRRPIPTCTVVLSVSWHTGGGGFFGNEGPAVAGVLFCRPPNSAWKEDVVELLRLVRVDNYEGPPLSGLISLGMKRLKLEKKYDLAISYADRTHEHHGGVYQGSSWNYTGATSPRVDGFIIGTRFVPNRTCSHLYGTQSISKIRERLKHKNTTIEKHYDLGKHLYWKAIRKSGRHKAARLGLKKLPYPKPDKINE